MNQLDMMTTLVDAARELPASERGRLKVAIRTADKRIEVLRARYKKRNDRRNAQAAIDARDDAELAAIAQANPDRFKAAGRCTVCGYILENCQCLADAENESLILMTIGHLKTQAKKVGGRTAV